MANQFSLEAINDHFLGKDIVSLHQFDQKSIQTVIDQAKKISKDLAEGKVFQELNGKIATLLFFEPSSRTFSSFAAAFKRLGGDTIDHQNPMQTSSAVKGETLEDSIKVFEAYSDIIIMRHAEKGAALRAAQAARHIPVINAGDGIGEHPTQALLDMYTIYEKFGRLDGLKILMAGDMLNGRTVHSLLKALSYFPDNTVYLLSPENLRLGPDFLMEIKKSGLTIQEISHEEEIPQDCHVWYWTRVQKERFTDLAEYERLKTSFIITPDLLERRGNDQMIILHPLPRVGEIDPRVDEDPRAWYLTHQVKNGMYVRMALCGLVLGKF